MIHQPLAGTEGTTDGDPDPRQGVPAHEGDAERDPVEAHRPDARHDREGHRPRQLHVRGRGPGVRPDRQGAGADAGRPVRRSPSQLGLATQRAGDSGQEASPITSPRTGLPDAGRGGGSAVLAFCHLSSSAFCRLAASPTSVTISSRPSCARASANSPTRAPQLEQAKNLNRAYGQQSPHATPVSAQRARRTSR